MKDFKLCSQSRKEFNLLKFKMLKLDINSEVKLNNDIHMPVFGLGTYQNTNKKDAFESVLYALKIGYRLIDTAAYYKNEDSGL